MTTAPPPPPKVPPPPPETSQKDGDFDQWLQSELKQLYDPTLDEDIPDYLIDLLNKAAKTP